MKKKFFTILLTVMLCTVTLAACAGNRQPSPQSATEPISDETRVITDSLGRNVTVPENVTRILPAGQLAQITLLSLCPDLMVALASEWDEVVKEYISSDVSNLPVVGQLYGGKKNFNLESILAANPQVIIDVGDAKEGMAEELDELTKQIGIPFIHLNGNLDKLSESYRLLGDLIGREDDANIRANYVEEKNTEFEELSSKLEKINALLITGPEGLNVIPKGSYQEEVFCKFANNLAIVEEPSSKGTGNEVDMERILKWNPDVILYLPETTEKEVFEGPVWQEVNAVKNHAVYHVPYGPYNWLGFPSAVQKYLGMMWMADTFYPENIDFDLYEEVKEYFALFYGFDLSRDKFEELISQD